MTGEVSSLWEPKMISCESIADNSQIVRLEFSPDAVEKFGAPKETYLSYTFYPDSGKIDLDVLMFNKTSSNCKFWGNEFFAEKKMGSLQD